MKRFLKSTTSLTLCVTLIVPSTGWSQDALACTAELEDRKFPCLVDDDILIETQDAFDALELDIAEEVAPVEEVVTEEAPTEDVVAEEAPTEDVVAEEAPTEEVVTEEAPTEDVVAEEAPTEDVVAEEAPTEEVVAEEALTEEVVTEEAPTEDVVAEETPAEEVVTEDAPIDEVVVEEVPTEEVVTEEAPAETATEEAPAETVTAEETPLEEEEAPAAAAAAAASTDTASTDAVVETEEVVADEVRSSSEEFETTVTGDATPEATAAAAAAPAATDSGGLSKFEKALIIGLGAVVVGSLLKNGDEVVSKSGDRVVVRRGGELRVLKDDDALLRRPGDQVRTETFNDGSTRTFVTQNNGSQIVTIRGSDGSVLSRTLITPDGEATVLFDDTVESPRVVVSELPKIRETTQQALDQDEIALRAALASQINGTASRRYSLRQVRNFQQVRALVPQIELDAVQFKSGSSAILPEQARSLAKIGTALRNLIADDPRTVILVEGHTDAVGSETYNLALSDRRTETVALALTEYFSVPPQNMITQGYGESTLKIKTITDEPANRRAVVRDITALLR